MKKSYWLCIAATMLFAETAPALEIDAETSIVIPEKAEESTRLSAKELTEYVQKSSGITLKTETGESAAPRQIIIGTQATLPNIPDTIRSALEKTDIEDAFFLLCKGDRLYIVGKDRVGELYGTYQFLEEHLGIRWFKAATVEDSNEYVPQMKQIRIDDFSTFRKPAFRYRKQDHCSATGKCPVNGQAFAVRIGYQISAPWNFARNFKEEYYMARTADRAGVLGGHTTFVDAVPVKLFDEHPEYFAFRDGKRQKGQQYCLSNPDVQERVYQFFCDLCRKYPPERINYLFGLIDTTMGWCECENCRKLDETETYDYVNISTRFHKVISAISKRIYEKYPEAHLLSWAYHTYRTIPKNVQYDPRMILYFCIHGRCYGHTLDDPSCERNRKLLELLKQWKKICKTVWTYEYTSATPPLYVPLELRQAKDLRFYRSIGIDGWKEEALFPDADFTPRLKPGEYEERPDRFNSNWQWIYVTAKLLWDPDLDENKILEDIESKYYGCAYPAMKKYHDFRRKLWENNPACMGYPTRDQRRPMLLNAPESTETLTAYLDEAEKLAKDQPLILKRIKQDRFWLERYWIAPYLEFKDKMEKAYIAPTRKNEIKIDGDPGDGAWTGAFHTSDFKFTFRNRETEIPADRKTTLSILCDDENLYFLITAMDPAPEGLQSKALKHDENVWSDDSVELFIMPPSAAQEYFHIAVNSKGVVYDAMCPGNHKEIDLGVVAAAKVLKDRYIVELKVPVAKIGKLQRGDLWRIHASRNRKNQETAPFAGIQSIDGVEPHDTSGYHGIIMGTPYLENGSLDVPDPKKPNMPKGWGGHGYELVKTTNGHAVKLPAYSNMQQMLYMQFFQCPEERKINVSLKASSEAGGDLSVSFLRYTDTPDPKAKYKYKRKIHPTETAAKFKLDGTTRIYETSYTIKPNEWVGLMIFFSGKKGSFAIVDDISLHPVK